MLKAAEAAKYLGLSPRKMYALAETGQIKKHPGGFDPAEIEAYKESCRRPPLTIVQASPPPKPLGWTMRPLPATPEPTARERRKQRKELEARRREARRALVLFHANKRRAAKLNRTPPWSNLDAMRVIYEQARRLTVETGIQHHVDHVIPLQGELVSGLHVPGNLQILTGSENSKKRNRYEP